MSIKGITVGTPIPRSDWNQEDPRKADYIKNKPDINGMLDSFDERLSDLSEHLQDDKNPHGVTCEQIGAASIYKTAHGNAITAMDSIEAPLNGLTIYGKTTQNGTPTPEAPVNLVSAGASGTINVSVTGKNMFGGDALADKFVEVAYATKDTEAGTVTATAHNMGGETFLRGCFKPNTRYTFILYGKCTTSSRDVANLIVVYTDSSYDQLAFNTKGEMSYCVYTSKSGKSVYRLGGSTKIGSTILQYNKCGVFEGVLTEADFVPYVSVGNLTAQTPNGLNSIGDVKDEIDFVRGVRVQRVFTEVFDGDESWTKSTSKSLCYVKSQENHVAGFGLCDQYIYSSDTTVPNRLVIGSDINFYDESITTLDAWKQRLAENPITVKYVLSEPIETPLSADELAQYAALHTIKPDTTVYNDASADMDVEYFSINPAVPMNYGQPRDVDKILAIGENGWVAKVTGKPSMVGIVASSVDITVGSAVTDGWEYYDVYN